MRRDTTASHAGCPFRVSLPVGPCHGNAHVASSISESREHPGPNKFMLTMKCGKHTNVKLAHVHCATWRAKKDHIDAAQLLDVVSGEVFDGYASMRRSATIKILHSPSVGKTPSTSQSMSVPPCTYKAFSPPRPMFNVNQLSKPLI